MTVTTKAPLRPSTALAVARRSRPVCPTRQGLLCNSCLFPICPTQRGRPACAGDADRLRQQSLPCSPSPYGDRAFIAGLRYVDPCLDFWSVPSSDVCGGLKPWLRSAKPCGLDQPQSPRNMARVTETPAPQGLPGAQGGLMEIEK